MDKNLVPEFFKQYRILFYIFQGLYMLFIYSIAFTMIAMLKKTRKKKYILTRHKNEGRRCGTHNRSRLQIKCALTENTQYTNTNFWILFIFSYFHATRAIQPRKKNWKPGSFEDYASKGCGISLPLIMT